MANKFHAEAPAETGSESRAQAAPETGAWRLQDLPEDVRNDPATPKLYSSWPDGDEGGRPRSSCVVITKDDGGTIGS